MDIVKEPNGVILEYPNGVDTTKYGSIKLFPLGSILIRNGKTIATYGMKVANKEDEVNKEKY